MCPVIVVILEVGFEYPRQVVFIQYYHMVEAVAPNRAYHPLDERILPGTTISGDHLFNAHSLYTLFENFRTVLCLTIIRQNIQNRTYNYYMLGLADETDQALDGFDRRRRSPAPENGPLRKRKILSIRF